jgi:hypothetical protein
MPPRVPHIFIDDVEHKKCCRCKQLKIIDDYNSDKSRWDNCRTSCKECYRKYIARPEIRKKRLKQDRKRKAIYRAKPENQKKINIYSSIYFKSEKGKATKKRKRERDKKDPIKRMKACLWSRTSQIFNKQGVKKDTSSRKMFGCNILKLHCHIERKFDFYMTPTNSGKKGWHIDHIIPVSAFDVTNVVEKAVVCWYKNLQPLWWKPNIQKGDTYKEEDKQAMIKEWIFYNI